MTICKGPQAFPRDEYIRRLTEVKGEMAKREIGVLVVSNATNITYLTGYTALSGYVPQGLVISEDREEPTFILRRQDAPAAHHQTFLDRANVIGYPEHLIGNPNMDGFDTVIDFLQEIGRAHGRLGLETGYLSSLSVEKFQTRLPETDIVDCTKAVAWIRGVKSDLEIAVMREAAAITDAAMYRAAEVIRPGVREADAAAEIAASLIRGTERYPGTNIICPLLCSSPRTGTSHINWSADTYRPGSQINVELGGIRHGYISALMRTFSIGKPSDRLQRLHDAEVAGLEAALETARPGATCSDVANAFYHTLGKSGFTKDSRCGYAIGIDWTEPTASLKDGDMTVLKPNMTFHLMLGNWLEEEFGYVISETFRVTETAPETFSALPRKIFEL